MENSSLINLRALINKFNDKNLCIPLLQRNYVWPEDTATNFLKDIINACKSEKTEYTIGMATFHYTNNSSDPIQIIDGQQRIITLCLLSKILPYQTDFLKINFERDTEKEERWKYLYSSSTDNANPSLDVLHMKNIESALQQILKENYNDINSILDKFWNYVLDHVKIIYRETPNEPLNEFLNLNENKISFSPTDYDRAYQLKYQLGKQEITPNMILKEHNLIEKYLYTNEKIFNLLKHGYGQPSNRMDLLFENDAFVKIGIPKFYENLDINDEPDKKYQQQYHYLKYCRNVLRSINDELQKHNNSELNANIYNAVVALFNQNKSFKFFDLIAINEKESFEQKLFNKFNLLDETYKNIKNKNAFMASQLSTTIPDTIPDTNNQTNSESIYSETEQSISDSIYTWFEDREQEVVTLIEKGKNYSDLSNGCTKSFYQILDLNEVDKIVIPEIQRDYTFGSNDDKTTRLLLDISSSYLDSFLTHNNLDPNKYDAGSPHKIICKCLTKKKIWPDPGSDNLNDSPAATIRAKYSSLFALASYSLNNFDFRTNSDWQAFSDMLCDFRPYLQLTTDDFAYIKMNKQDNNNNPLYFNDAGEKDFPFGTILGSLENHQLYIYDGQQRLVTLVFLSAYIIAKNYSSENKDTYDDYINLLKKFKFENRDAANSLLTKLLTNLSEFSLKDEMAVDHTTYSIIHLLNIYENYTNNYEKDLLCFDLTYLMKKIIFEFVIIQSSSTIEQLYMDLNTNNIPLTPSENYKAELVHKLNSRFNNLFKDDWKLQLDNLFLNKCYDYLNSNDTTNIDRAKIENLEMNAIHWCFKMAALEYGFSIPKLEDSHRLSWLDEPHSSKIVECVGKILNNTDNQNLENLLRCSPWKNSLSVHDIFELWYDLRISITENTLENIKYISEDGKSPLKVFLPNKTAKNLALHILFVSKQKNIASSKSYSHEHDLKFLTEKYHTYWTGHYLQTDLLDEQDSSKLFLDYFSEEYLEGKPDCMTWIEYIYYVKLQEIQKYKNNYLFIQKWENTETSLNKLFEKKDKKFGFEKCNGDYTLWSYIIKDINTSISSPESIKLTNESDIDIDDVILNQFNIDSFKKSRIESILNNNYSSVNCTINYSNNDSLKEFIHDIVNNKFSDYLNRAVTDFIFEKYYIDMENSGKLKIYTFDNNCTVRALGNEDFIKIGSINFTIEDIIKNILPDKKNIENSLSNKIRFIWRKYKKTLNELELSDEDQKCLYNNLDKLPRILLNNNEDLEIARELYRKWHKGLTPEW